MLQHFNLSRNKYLRTLEITTESIAAANDTASGFLKTVLSSVASPAPIDVVIIYRDYDLGGIQFCIFCDPGSICFWHHSQLLDRIARGHQQQLGMFRKMYNSWDFRLVLCADVSDCMVEHSIEMLGNIAKVAQLPHEPLITSERRTLRSRSTDHIAGWSGRWQIPASAL